MATPLTADRIVAALRAEGIKVVEHPGWRGHHRNHVGKWGPVNGVMIHHTVSSGTTHSVELCFTGYDKLPGPLCHGVIAKDGTVHLISDGRANHAGGGDPDVLAAVQKESYDTRPPAPNEHQGSPGAVDGNARFYGFECINLGDGVDPWPAVQVEAIVRASAALSRAHGWGAKSVIGHSEWSDWKSDPKGPDNVVSMPGLRKRIADRLAHPASWNPGDKPTTPKPPAPQPPTETDMEPIDFWNYRNAKADEASVKAGHGRIPDAYGYLVLTNQLVVKLNAAVDTLTKKVAELEARTRP
ncbi:MAG TPA: N-acetylmuramoyl-L-alanine amidase [Nocardioidaceae bacterium]